MCFFVLWLGGTRAANPVFARVERGWAGIQNTRVRVVWVRVRPSDARRVNVLWCAWGSAGEAALKIFSLSEKPTVRRPRATSFDGLRSYRAAAC